MISQLMPNIFLLKLARELLSPKRILSGGKLKLGKIHSSATAKLNHIFLTQKSVIKWTSPIQLSNLLLKANCKKNSKKNQLKLTFLTGNQWTLLKI